MAAVISRDLISEMPEALSDARERIITAEFDFLINGESNGNFISMVSRTHRPVLSLIAIKYPQIMATGIINAKYQNFCEYSPIPIKIRV